MSWSGFKKNVGRATTQVMMKTGHVEKTSDRGYEVEERRYRTLESASLRLQKEAKGYLDSLRAMTASQMRIAETIDAFYGDSGATDGVSRSYKQAVEDLDAETVKALDGPYRLVEIPKKEKLENGESRLHRYLAREGSLQPYLVNRRTGGLDESLIREIESEYYSTKRREHDGKRMVDIMGEFKGEYELIGSLCRTTVLEPINRFCAYFPDINECIKKRNNKMLDYDSMRSKVRRLTEKPDKDASKLPRAEKEADMVSLTNFLDEHRVVAPHASLAPLVEKRLSMRTRMARPTLLNVEDLEADLERELEMPSPPKAEHSRELSDARRWSTNLLARLSEAPSPGFNNSEFDEAPARQSTDSHRSSEGDALVADEEAELRKANAELEAQIIAGLAAFGVSTGDKGPQRDRADSKRSSLTLVPTISSADSTSTIDNEHSENAPPSSSTDALLPSPGRSFSSSTAAATAAAIAAATLFKQRSFGTPTPAARTVKTPYGPLPLSPLTHSTTNPNTYPTSFFTPSELHDIMQPLHAAFVKQRADQLTQAKAAYEQLNEQLSTELPQLIDLRVPYLDPSFEALVKIQLRFCAEAYSRMAQVQQYLDPQTRDQYASGELDQRVEDVLGQIRELSIAGTV